MGEVIAFRANAKQARRAAAPPAGDAQILFFLGVRYVRVDDPSTYDTRTPEARNTPSGGKKRKRRARA